MRGARRRSRSSLPSLRSKYRIAKSWISTLSVLTYPSIHSRHSLHSPYTLYTLVHFVLFVHSHTRTLSYS